MLSVGWIMFWKAVVLGTWAGVAAQYAVYKTKRARNGITLKHDRRRNLHYDPLERWEARGRTLQRWTMGFFYVWGSICLILTTWFFFTR